MDKIALIKDLEAARSRIAELEQNQKDRHQRFTRWWSETPEASFDEWMEDPSTHWTCEEDAAWQAWQHLFEEVIFDMRERISDLEGAHQGCAKSIDCLGCALPAYARDAGVSPGSRCHYWAM